MPIPEHQRLVQPLPLEQTYRESYSADLIDLSASAPEAPTLSELLGETTSLHDVALGYGSSGGSWELRSAIAALYPGLGPEHIVVTAGAIEAIRAASMALVSPGTRVLLQSPSYAALHESVASRGGEIVDWPADEQGCFDLAARPDDCDSADLAWLSSPHSPSGSLVRGLSRFRGRLVVDEVYRPLCLQQQAASALDISEDALVIGDLSKPLGLGGLRIGWLASRDLSLLASCQDALDHLSGSVSVLSDYLAIQALLRYDELIEPRLRVARENLTSLTRFVEGHRNLIEWSPPQAGITACLHLRSGEPDDSFFAKLRAAGVFLVPGRTMGLPGHLRISLGLNRQAFDLALQRLGRAIEHLETPAEATREPGDVILFTKLPYLGYGKSRLAASIGAEAAAAMASAFLVDSLRLGERGARRLFISVDAESRAAELKSAAPDAVFFEQPSGDQGGRLAHAFDSALRQGACRPVLIGSDSPTLPPHLIAVAQQALQSNDVVIGPARDGGYYLIGMNRAEPSLFEGIDWGTSRVFQQTVERCAAAGMRVFVLPAWYDIDTIADCAYARGDAAPDSATGTALARMRLA